MRSFIKAASFVAATIAVLAVFTPSLVQAQDGSISYDKRTAHNNQFKATGFNPLMALAEGPYPNAAADSIEKRAVSGTCDPGWQVCTAAGGYCCRNEAVCAKDVRLCCDRRAPFVCSGTKCCPYNSCDLSGDCGCPASQTKCGTDCCSNGCDKTGFFCACPFDKPVDCGGMYCCSIGASCSAGSTCSTAATVTTRIGSTPTTIVIGGGRNAGSNTKAASSFAAVLGAAALVFGA
ncbi:hypothetical protein BGZ95_003645 [Linnemannia exigua]|uniref:Uncharacterized protein n=1 Tax=Linnemannia exigua TaxID=604196 RepID=A0AAD4D5N0_9FUNG|nr:hypothetical protein BGZ95_003645 [Linnemannia exigua]